MSKLTTLTASPLYNRILSRFPQQFALCFAYGSGVKKQLQAPKTIPQNNMIDLIFCVDNPYRWHQANIQTNPSHYSGCRHLGHKFVVKLQENFGAKVYFNTLVEMEGKYSL